MGVVKRWNTSFLACLQLFMEWFEGNSYQNTFWGNESRGSMLKYNDFKQF